MSECRFFGTKGDAGAVYKRIASGNARAVDERPVGAAAILDRRSISLDCDAGMLPRHALRVDPDGARRVTSDDVLPLGERKRRFLPAQPPLELVLFRGSGHGAGMADLGAEQVAAARHRGDIGGSLRVVAENTPDLGDGVADVRFVDEHIRPDAILKRCLADDCRPVLYEDLEQIERL